jgi:branched-chain amino acid transport system permease protein
MAQAIVTGLLLGGFYALIGVGMSLIFGIMKITNIAHGSLMVLAAFFSMTFALRLTGQNIILALLCTIVVMIILGMLIQKFLINRVIDKGSEPALLVMFGLSILIENALLLGYGANSNSIGTDLNKINILHSDLVSISGQYALNCAVAVAVIVVLAIVIHKTAFGRSIRATAADDMATELMGISTKRMYIYAMALTMGATCVSGLLMGQTFVFYPTSGTQYLIIAFGVVVIGGMGSIIGTLIGGIILGLAQLVGAQIFGIDRQLLIGYLVMLVILAVRPQGLLSKGFRQ